MIQRGSFYLPLWSYIRNNQTSRNYLIHDHKHAFNVFVWRRCSQCCKVQNCVIHKHFCSIWFLIVAVVVVYPQRLEMQKLRNP